MTPDHAIPSSRQGGSTTWVLIAIVVVPLAGIVVTLALRPEGPEPHPSPSDPIAALRARAADLQREFPEVARSDSDAKKRAFLYRLQEFMTDFHNVMAPYMDEDGYLLDEYRGYRSITRPIVQMSVDVSRQSGFELEE